MNIRDISLPEVYKESADFRFFCNWFAACLRRVQYDTENFIDLYDPLRCPSDLLWMLADTMGFKYDDRLCTAFNRLVLIYFMSMIRNRGSKDGVTLAAEVNLAQFNIEDYGKKKDILYNRLEDTSIPVNAVYVTPHVEEGYIDVVYFSDTKPVDACIEYVRPLGMYLFQHAGMRFDSRTKISVDARLTNINDLGMSIGATHVGHYSRDDYARMQKMVDEPNQDINTRDKRNNVYHRNSEFEGKPDSRLDPGRRAVYSLQLCNNEHIVRSLIDPIFSLGYGPQSNSDTYDTNPLPKKLNELEYAVSEPPKYLKPEYQDKPAWNLRLDRELEEYLSKDVYTVEGNRTTDPMNPRPAVNPVMTTLGDAISMNADNTKYTKVDEDGNIDIVDT